MVENLMIYFLGGVLRNPRSQDLLISHPIEMFFHARSHYEICWRGPRLKSAISQRSKEGGREEKKLLARRIDTTFALPPFLSPHSFIDSKGEIRDAAVHAQPNRKFLSLIIIYSIMDSFFRIKQGRPSSLIFMKSYPFPSVTLVFSFVL